MAKTILHIDLDSFFATVEQQANPYLRGKPVGIVKAAGRTCVIASSVEAKRRGVVTGMPLNQAQFLCPELVLVPADFDKYFAVTRRFYSICSDYTPEVEIFSIDELFLDLTSTRHLFPGGPYFAALDIQNRVKREVGDWISCSVGISYNKLLAKLASSQKKPAGIFFITRKNRDEVLAKVDLDDICGIGWRLKKRLIDAGIVNLLQIRQIPMENLAAAFGPFWSVELKRLALGEDDSPLITSDQLPDPKSVSRTFTLFADATSPRVVKQTLRNLCEEAAAKMRAMGMMGRQVGLAIRGGGLGSWGHRTFKTFTDDGREIFNVCWQLYTSWNWRYPVRFVGVWVSLLARRDELTADIFPEKQKREKLLAGVDAVNNRFGDFTLYPASLLGREIIRPEVNGYLGDKKFRLGISTLRS